MLYFNIFSWEPEKRDEVIKRILEKGQMIPEGMKVITNLVDLQGSRTLTVMETDDPKAILAFHLAWCDLGRIETCPVMEIEEVLEALKGK